MHQYRLLLILVIPAVGGCGRPAPQTLVTGENGSLPSTQTAPARAPETGSNKSLNELPPLADPLPPLDDGRVEVAGPEGWSVPPRDPKWLARFQLSGSKPYPIILVHRPEERSGAADVTPERAATFAANLQRELKDESEAKGLTPPQVDPLVIGDFAGAEYARQAVIKGKELRLERLYLTTVRGQRRYTVELDAVYGTMNEFRDFALAVAAGMKFVEPSEEPVAPP